MIRLTLVAGLLLAGCASAPRPAAQAAATPAEAGTVAAADAVPVDAPAAGPAMPAQGEAEAAPQGGAGPAAPTVDTAARTAAGQATDQAAISGESGDIDDDFADIYGTDAGTGEAGAAAVAYDPWEPMNRRIHRFNMAVDRAIARPLARVYVAAVPRPVRTGVTNFFDNLGSPVTFVNQLLQGRPRDAVQTLGRFLVNSTLGIGGLLDPASDLKMKRRSEDFGQTLGVWGWRRSRYVELPFFGPRTLRDVVGLGGDLPLSATRQIEEDKVRIGLQGLQLVDTRVRLMPLDDLRDAAPDEYVLTRDAWLQRRNYLIEADRHRRAGDGDLPDYLRDEERDPTVPADAIPLPGG